MTVDEILKSIAITSSDPDHCFARKSDCHWTTAMYIRSDKAKNDDSIVLYGDGGHVYHSIVINASNEVVSDSFKLNTNIEFDPETLNVQYRLDSRTVTFKPIRTITIGDFRRDYMLMSERVSFKDYIRERV